MEKKEILLAIFEEIMNDLPPTHKYKELQSQLVKDTETFLKVVGEQNREELEKMQDLIYDMGNEQGKQLFFKGFSLAVRLLFIEAISKD